MTNEEKEYISDALLKMSTLKRRPMDIIEIKTWVDAIKDAPIKFPVQEWIEAIRLTQYSKEDFPTMGKLYEGIKGKNTVDDASLSQDAWQVVIGHISRKGSNVLFEGDHQIKIAIRAAGGLQSIGTADGVNLDFKKKAFIEHYKNNISNDAQLQISKGTEKIEGIEYGNGKQKRIGR